jgi:hypothetical protein
VIIGNQQATAVSYTITRDLLIVRREGTPLGPAGAMLREMLLDARYVSQERK